MVLFETVCVAFSMFSALPVPQISWSERNMKYSLLAFPLIGAVIAAAMLLWDLFAGKLGLPSILRGAGFCLIPLWITGGIHLDGYADTWDAISSHGDIEKRQIILRDPHIGAFGVMHLGIWFTASAALWIALPRFAFLPALASFCLSRSLSALALTVYPLRPGAGIARSFADASARERVRTILLVASAVCALLMLCSGAWAMIPAAGAVFLYYGHMAKKHFGGISGDLAGWFLQTAELAMLAAWCFQQYGGNLQ